MGTFMHVQKAEAGAVAWACLWLKDLRRPGTGLLRVCLRPRAQAGGGSWVVGMMVPGGLQVVAAARGAESRLDVWILQAGAAVQHRTFPWPPAPEMAGSSAAGREPKWVEIRFVEGEVTSLRVDLVGIR